MAEKKKTLWVPEDWQRWLNQYFKEQEAELEKLGIKSTNDLVWRLAELGKDELSALVEFYRQSQDRKLQRHGKG